MTTAGRNRTLRTTELYVATGREGEQQASPFSSHQMLDGVQVPLVEAPEGCALHPVEDSHAGFTSKGDRRANPGTAHGERRRVRDIQAGSALRAGTWMMPGNLMATTSRRGMTDESVRQHLIAFSYGPGCFKNPASG
jgi:hypothetical protein